MKYNIIIPVILICLLLSTPFLYCQMMGGRHHMMIMPSRNQDGQWVAPPQADKLVNPTANNAAAVKAGEKIFQANCVVCHGDKGKGDGVGGVSLNPKPANFTTPFIKKEKDGALFWKMTTGNAPMPSYKQLFNDQQRWELVDYIRELQKQQ